MSGSQEPNRWTIVLAGGEGERLRALTERWLGAHRPKQYCAFLGGRAMLEHTHERALALSAPERVVTVIGKGHRRFLESPRPLKVEGELIEQPANRDTAVGLLPPLCRVLREDPGALVAVLPSDHFVYPNRLFTMHVRQAFYLARHMPDRVIMLGVPADRPETDYGWIESGGPVTAADFSARRVLRFHEKPHALAADAFHKRGWHWSTMVLVARAETLWQAVHAALPDLAARFHPYRALGGRAPEPREAALLYEDLPAANLSRHVLQARAESCVLLPLIGVYWEDWGTPPRILETARRLNLVPRFLKRHADPSLALKPSA